MIILGINYFFHDTSACLVRDGKLTVALEEERFSRQKHTWEFPHAAVKRALREAGVAPADVDHVAVSIAPWEAWRSKAWFAARLGGRMLPFVKHELVRARDRQREFHRWFRATWPDGKVPQIHQVKHHLAHVSGSYFVSPYEHAALISLDGSGEWSTGWIGEAKGTQLTCFGESVFPHSLGIFYEAATEFCGFQPNYDEGKTMGLAPFGDPERFLPAMDRLVRTSDAGSIVVDGSYFEYQNWGRQRCGARYHEAFGAPRRRYEEIEKRHEDVAAAAQRVLEERVLELCRILEQRSSAEYLVVAGGVALNSVMNGRLLRDTRFKDLYVMPAAGDNGTSIGAAYHVYNGVLGRQDRSVHDDPYLGTAYDNEQIEATLEECKLGYERSADVCKDAARLLHEGNIVGWFQGRMEFGPRALGNRSILADPTRPEMKDKINAEVKHREAYRPFAPSALAEESGAWFDIDVEAPFMLKVCQVRPDARARLPAITHVDGSARLQTVRAETNPTYHRLIREFAGLSGVPVILNTSFNVMGEPIVESPIQAIRCFYSCGLDALVIGDFVLRK